MRMRQYGWLSAGFIIRGKKKYFAEYHLDKTGKSLEFMKRSGSELDSRTRIVVTYFTSVYLEVRVFHFLKLFYCFVGSFCV